jgi:hypothetical protein
MVDLICIAEDAVSRQGRSAMPRADFIGLAAEIRRFHALPAEGVRSTHSAAALLELIEGLAAVKASDDAARRPWLMLIGAALPLLRAEAYQQLLNEKEARHG